MANEERWAEHARVKAQVDELVAQGWRVQRSESDSTGYGYWLLVNDDPSTSGMRDFTANTKG